MCVCSLFVHFLKLKTILGDNGSLWVVPSAPEDSWLTFRKKGEKGSRLDGPGFTDFSRMGPYLSGSGFFHALTSTSPFITLPHHWGPPASSSLNDKGSRCPAERDGLPISSPTVVSV